MSVSPERIAWRWRAYGISALAVLAVAFGAAMWGSGSEDVQTGGDLPAFYAGARVLDEDASMLYDFEAQTAAQQGLDSSTEPGALLYVHPPAVAAAFVPLSRLDYLDAFAVLTLALFVAVIASVALLTKNYIATPEKVPALMVMCVLFGPMAQAIAGSQLTPFLLLGLVALLVGEERGWPDLILGLVGAALLMKPQIGVPVLGLLLLRPDRRLVPVIAAGVFFAVNALVLGPGWVGDWVEAIRSFQAIELVAEFPGLVSWRGFFQRILGSDSRAAELLSVVVGALHVAALCWFWRPASKLAVRDRYSVLAPLMLLLSPHAIFYDVGIVLLSVLHLWMSGRLSSRWLLAFWLAGWASWIGPVAKVHPAFMLLAIIAALSVRDALRQDRSPSLGLSS